MKEEIPFENGAYIDNFDGKIVIASSDSIFYLRRLPWEEQIDSLLDSGKSQEAIELCDTLSENGLISNRDFENTKLVQVKAELEELSQDNESAFLYGQTGDHAKAFELYLGKHMDHERALKHCIYYSKQENSNETFRILLNIYLDLYKEYEFASVFTGLILNACFYFQKWPRYGEATVEPSQPLALSV